MIKRRNFLALSGAAVTASLSNSLAWWLPSASTSLGVQLFTIPKLVDDDLKGTLQLLSDIGYREVEFFGPYPFSAPETIERWKGLAAQLGFKRNAFYGYSAQDAKKMCTDYNLGTPSVHLDLITLRKNRGPAMDALAAMGVKYAAIPALVYPEERAGLDDYKKLADEFSAHGEAMSKYGLTFVYHNHGYEHAVKEGEIPMEILLTRCDTRYVKFELDIFWMTAAGASPVDFLKRHPGKFKLMHIKDAKEAIRFAGDGGTPEQWMELFPKMADPGSGIFDIKAIIEQGRKSGVDHFFLERDLAPDPLATLKNSFQFLSAL